MRSQAYLLFEIVAWPALAWCGAEVALRMAAGAFEGLASTAITGAMAGLTIAACRLRTAQLTAAVVRR